jgi:hypothetical protein
LVIYKDFTKMHGQQNIKSSLHSYVLLLVTPIFILPSHLHVRLPNDLFVSGFPIKIVDKFYIFSCYYLYLEFDFFHMKDVVSVVTINIFKSPLHRFVNRFVFFSASRISDFLIMPLPKTVSPLLTTPVYLSPCQVNMSMCIPNLREWQILFSELHNWQNNSLPFAEPLVVFANHLKCAGFC